MKVIDFEKKGNLVRFYLGQDDDSDYWGDDWDDSPYECNAGSVYNRYIFGYADILYPFDYSVKEPCEGWNHGMSYEVSKEDMKEGACPCIVTGPDGDYGEEDYFGLLSMKDRTQIYLGNIVSLDGVKKYRTHILGGLLVNYAVWIPLNQGGRSRFEEDNDR